MHYNMTAEEQAEHVRRVKAADAAGGQANGHAPPASAARPSLNSQVRCDADREDMHCGTEMTNARCA